MAMSNRGFTDSAESSDEKMKIYLEVFKTVPLKVKRSDTIRDLKAVVRDKEDVAENFQELYYGGNRLKDDWKLIECGVQNNSTLHCYVSVVVKLLVKIASQNKLIEVEAESPDTIHSIKLRIQASLGIHSGKYTLLYAGKKLGDSRTLASLGIKDEATLNLVFDPKDELSLSVQLPTGNMVKIEVKILYTVLDVKEIVGSIGGFSGSDYNLFYEGKKLDDSLTLASCNIEEESVLRILRQEFQIFVKLWSGKTITIYVCETDTVSDVKEKILHKFGELDNFPRCYYFIAAGRILKDDQDLGRIGIQKHCTLSMIVRIARHLHGIDLSEITGNVLPKSTTIGQVKELIKDELKEPVSQLLYRGQELLDHKTLADYSLKKNAFINFF